MVPDDIYSLLWILWLEVRCERLPPHMEAACHTWGLHATHGGCMPHMGAACHTWGCMPHMGAACHTWGLHATQGAACPQLQDDEALIIWQTNKKIRLVFHSFSNQF